MVNTALHKTNIVFTGKLTDDVCDDVVLLFIDTLYNKHDAGSRNLKAYDETIIKLHEDFVNDKLSIEDSKLIEDRMF